MPRRSWHRTREAAAAGAQLVTFPEMMLTGYPAEDLVLRESFRARRAPRWRSWPPTSRTPASATPRVIVGYLDEDGGPRKAATLYLDERTGPRNAAAFCLGGRIVATLLQAPPAELRRVRRGALLRAGDRFTVVRLPRRRRRADDLRGHLAGGRPVRGRRPGRRRARRQHQRLALRAQQGRRAAAAAAAPGRARPRRRSSTSTPSAARTSWSSTATRWWSAPDGTVLAAGAAVRRGPVLRRPRPVAAADGRPGRRRPAGDAVEHHATAHRPRAGRTDAAPAAVAAADRATRPRCGTRWSPACATTSARTASARWCSACPAASTRRWSPRSPPTRSAATNVYGVSMPSAYSSEHSQVPTPPTSPRASARITGRADRADGRRRSSSR